MAVTVLEDNLPNSEKGSKDDYARASEIMISKSEIKVDNKFPKNLVSVNKREKRTKDEGDNMKEEKKIQKLNKPAHLTKRQFDYNTRDLSWLDFNNRILDMSEDESIPLLERCKFLAISSSNLDEFTMVRLSHLMDIREKTPALLNIMGESAKKELTRVEEIIEQMLARQHVIADNLTNALSNNKVKIIKANDLFGKERKFVERYFDDRIFPLLTPIVFDSSKAFPRITNKSINIGVIIKEGDGKDNKFGTIVVPDFLDRLIEIDTKAKDDERHFILLEDAIIANLDSIFKNKKVSKYCVYRVLRKVESTILKNDKFAADSMEEFLNKREQETPIRLDITSDKKELIKILYKTLKMDKDDISKFSSYVDLSFFMDIANVKFNKPELVYEPFKGKTSTDIIDEDDIIGTVAKHDILLHHPYESFDTVLDFIKQASEDPNVLAIKQTLYRVSANSPIMESLINAAKNGKQVTVVLEIKAKFDEKNNLAWAYRLEEAGGHVIYGAENLKTHCKMCLVIAKSKKGNLKKYAHIGTGNYNEKNSKIYTDISLLTANPTLCNDIHKLFNVLTGSSEPKMHRLIYSPIQLRSFLMEKIDEEIKFAKEGKEAMIAMKINAITDKQIIDKLYEASMAGVRIEMVVRSACSLVTNTDKSKNIKVTSIVGRFLEHSRIFYFKNSKYQLYIGSADLMERNLDRRFETLVPINKDETEEKLKDIMNAFLSDSVCYQLDGNHFKRIISDEKFSAQEYFRTKITEKENIESRIYSR